MGFNIQKLMGLLLQRRVFVLNIVILILIKFSLTLPVFQLATILDITDVFSAKDVIQETNIARSAQNISPLGENEKLNEAARQKLEDMLSKNYFLHISPEGVTPWFWMKNNDYQYSVAGENLAIGFFSAKDTVTAWLNSPLHRANLLNSSYEEIGIAVGKGKIGEINGTVIVQMFGKQFNPVVATNVQQNTVTPTPLIRASKSPISTQAIVAPIQTIAPTPIVQATEAIIPVEEVIVPVQYVSTDITIEPVNETLTVNVSSDKTYLYNLSSFLNNIYTIYALLLTIFSFALFLLMNRRREYLQKAIFSASLLVLSIVLPIISISYNGTIF